MTEDSGATGESFADSLKGVAGLPKGVSGGNITSFDDLENLLVDPSELKMKGPKASKPSKGKPKPGKTNQSRPNKRKNFSPETGNLRSFRPRSHSRPAPIIDSDFVTVLFTKLPPNYRLYKNKFIDLGVDYDLARHITNETLQSMGVADPLKRMKILKAISVVLRERPQVIHPSKVTPISPLSPSRPRRFKPFQDITSNRAPSTSGYSSYRSRHMPDQDDSRSISGFSTYTAPVRNPYSRGPRINARQAGMAFMEDTGSVTSPQMRFKFKGEDYNDALRSTRSFTAGRANSETGSMRSFKRDPSPSTRSQKPNIIRVATEPELDVFNLSWRIDDSQLSELHYGKKITSNPMRLLLGTQTITCYLTFLLGYKEDTIHSLHLSIEFSDIPAHSGNVSVNVHNIQSRGLILQTETKPVSHKNMDLCCLSSYDPVFRPMIHALNQSGMEFKCTIQLFMEDSPAITNIEKDRELQIFRQMYDDRSLADCRLRCDSQTWHVHKCVLAAQSEAWKRHFQNNTRELVFKSEPSLIDELVHWIYLGRVRHEERMRDLLQVAYKHEVKGLLEHCLTFLASSPQAQGAGAGFTVSSRDLARQLDILNKSPNNHISKYEPIYQLFQYR